MGWFLDRDGKLVKLQPCPNSEDALPSAKLRFEEEDNLIDSVGGKRMRVDPPLVGTDYGYFNIGKVPRHLSWCLNDSGTKEKMYHLSKRAALFNANEKFREYKSVADVYSVG